MASRQPQSGGDARDVEAVAVEESRLAGADATASCRGAGGRAAGRGEELAAEGITAIEQSAEVDVAHLAGQTELLGK